MGRENFSELTGEEIVLEFLHRLEGESDLTGILAFASPIGDFELDLPRGHNERPHQGNLVAPDYAVYRISTTDGNVIMENEVVKERYKKYSPVVRQTEFPEIEAAEIWTY